MSLGNCSVVFDNNPFAVLQAGQRAVGTVFLIMRKAKKLDRIVLKFTGETNVNWTETETYHDHHYSNGKSHVRTRTRAVHYHGKHVHTKTRQVLIESPSGPGTPWELKEGDYKFRFAFDLPRDLPSSFNGTYGKTAYAVKVTLERSHKFNLSHVSMFNVLSDVNLNVIPEAKLPVESNNKKSFYFLFMKKGNLAMDLKVPMSGYAPGQSIPAFCRLVNTGKVVVRETEFKLKMVTTFTITHPTSKSRTTSQTISVTKGAGVDANQENAFTVDVKIPSTPPTTRGSCLISTSYILKMKASVSGLHGDPEIWVPLTIGTVAIFPNPYLENDPPPSYVLYGYNECEQPTAPPPPLDKESSAYDIKFIPRYPTFRLKQ